MTRRLRWALGALILLLTACTAAGAHEGTKQNESWKTIDDPQLKGPARDWHNRTHVEAAGDDYAWTYGTGDSDSRANWAVWGFGHRHGVQRVYVFIPRLPSNHSENLNATVKYRIYRNGDLLATRTVDQSTTRGWKKLGDWHFNGGIARVETWDNETKEDYHDGYGASRFAVDAASMKCLRECDATQYNPDNIEDLVLLWEETYNSLQQVISEQRRTQNEFAAYKRCVKKVGSDYSVALSELGVVLRVEGLVGAVFGPIPAVGTAVNAWILGNSPIADKLEFNRIRQHIDACS